MSLPLIGAGPSAYHYFMKVKALGPIAYWPLWDAAGASSAVDLMGLGNGNPSNVTFGATGIGDGRTSASFNATTSKVDVYSSALNAAFTPTLCTVGVFGKVAGASVWTDGATRTLLNIGASATNRLTLQKASANNTIAAIHYAGGTLDQRNISGISTTDWFSLVLTVNKAGDQAIAYYNGNPESPLITLGTWSGALSSSLCNIGAYSTNVNVWSGFIGHVFIFNKVLTPAQVTSLANP